VHLLLSLALLAAAIFQIIWNLMKVWIDKPTLAKIFVLSKSEKTKLLAKEFSPEVMPKCMKVIAARFPDFL
jgi:hypothetical protein